MVQWSFWTQKRLFDNDNNRVKFSIHLSDAKFICSDRNNLERHYGHRY